jgi:CDP-glucose 4,6-dehydratase
MLEARVSGYSLPPDGVSLYEKVRFGGSFQDTFGDVRDMRAFEKAVKKAKPEIIFHLAAQAIVSTAFLRPAETFAANVMGTVNLLEILRASPDFKALIVVTSDKVYENTETMRPYTETNRLGGDEPYSASKAACELAVNAYRNVYFKSDTGIATARASNVYGGGDLHFDRLIPYLLKAKITGERAEIRNPGSIRPWQYILNLLDGYMKLAESLSGDAGFSGCWNFGPPQDEIYKVGGIFNLINEGSPLHQDGSQNFYEAGLLLLDSKKSESLLHWKPKVKLELGLSESADFYEGLFEGRSATDLMEKNILSYMRLIEGKF